MNENDLIHIDEIHRRYDLFDELLIETSQLSPSQQIFPNFPDPLSSQSPLPDPTNLTILPQKTHCTCQRSRCRKNYCPCYRKQNKCNQSCICIQCINKLFLPKYITFAIGSIDQFLMNDFYFDTLHQS